ncbi:hypothetical protein R1T16_16590 [Flavobacterium sp. DG1-102-2]|uniref:hypothetical protein n=1 Tax=Flavobacterium sp. DG1-102-2 TaxID=3081663 RepID=UPI002949A934|nr:hypothetical protein [Flavobacterium sp. DG1-102-2]MDV6170058.1 hypothetical protein [Flavobacterium sp. DG1-102-2]
MKIILERNLDFNQFKNIFILDFLSLAFFVVLFKLEATLVLQIIAVAIILLLTSLLFIRKGIIVKNESLFIGYFLFGLQIIKKEVYPDGMNIITQLVYQKSTNYNYGTKWEPCFDFKTPSFELYFVNEKHTTKKKILGLTNEENSEKTINFILLNSMFQFQKYSPDFY